MGASHTAAGQYQGYTLQDVRRAFYLLAAPPDASVSVEHKDDVTVHFADGRELWEQTKSAQSGNPLADASADLWKTLVIWGNSWGGGAPVGPARDFRLFVTPQRPLGKFARALHTAVADGDADKFVEAAEKLFASGPGHKVSQQLKAFLKLDKDARRYVVVRASIDSPENDEYDLIEEKIGAGFPRRFRALAADHVIGWAQTQGRRLISLKQPSLLKGKDAREVLEDYIRRCNLGNILTCAPKPEKGAVATQVGTRPTFIRQMELINAPNALKTRAAADFLQAAATRTLWAQKGILTPPAQERWEEKLVRDYELAQAEVGALMASASAELRGTKLFAQCSARDGDLDGTPVEKPFVSGSYQDLADRQELGWHEDYQALLEGGS